jgi:hypothetical protein
VLAAAGQMPPAAMTISELPTVLRCLAHFGFSVALGNQPCSHERRDVEHHPLEQPIEPYTVEFGFPWLFRDLDLHPPTHVLTVTRTAEFVIRAANVMPERIYGPFCSAVQDEACVSHPKGTASTSRPSVEPSSSRATVVALRVEPISCLAASPTLASHQEVAYMLEEVKGTK